MKRIMIICTTLLVMGSCAEQCIQCEGVSGYPNATICQDTYQTTTNEQSPSWSDYQSEAVNAGCVKQ